MSNPTLPPSIAAEFRKLEERIRALEMGESSLSYRQMMTTNDASVARVLHSADGDKDVYSAALVNPKYEVLVARFHVQLYGTSQMDVRLRAAMNGTVRTTQTWDLTGKTGPNAWAFHTIEVAWLHGMPINQWDEADEDTAIRRGNVEFHGQVGVDHVAYFRNPDAATDLLGNGFSGAQPNGLIAWFAQKSNLYDCYFREPEYVFLAPLSSFPTASLEGTLLPGSVIDD